MLEVLKFIVGYVFMLMFAYVMIFILFNPTFRQSWRNSKFIDQMKKQELDKPKKKYPKDMIPRYKGDANE